MAVPYHTHDFEIPVATKDDVVAGVSNNKALTPASVGNAAARNVEDFATAEQGVKASTAVQPEDLAKVATTGDYNDLNNLPVLGSVASRDITEVATAAQGALADTAVQPHDIGTAAAHDETDFATAEQGAKADSALQPDDVKSAAYHEAAEFATAIQGAKADTALQPADIQSAAHHEANDFATAEQGVKADSALQSDDVKSAAHHDASDFATAAQGVKAESAVQPETLKALAYKDKTAVTDIDATGNLERENFLSGDGSWRNPNIDNSAFYASGNFKTVPNPSKAEAVYVQFTATSKVALISAILEVKTVINYDIQIYINVKDLSSGRDYFIGRGMFYGSTIEIPRQAAVNIVYSDLVPGRAYRAHMQLFTVDHSSNDTVTTYISGGCI